MKTYIYTETVYNDDVITYLSDGDNKIIKKVTTTGIDTDNHRYTIERYFIGTGTWANRASLTYTAASKDDEDIKPLISASTGGGKTALKSLPVSKADSNTDNTYFFSWNTLGIDNLTLLQLFNNGSVVTDAQIAWSDTGVTVSGITSTTDKRLVYIIPTQLTVVSDAPTTIAVTSIEIVGASAIQDSGTLTATVLPANATNSSVTWSSSNTSVAIVTGGAVTVLTAGETIISATSVSNPTVVGTKTIACTVSIADTVLSGAVTTSVINSDWQVNKLNGTAVACTLPHSINAEDSSTSSYYRGIVVYKRSITMDTAKRYYLYVDGGIQRGNVLIGGTIVGTLSNAYQPTVIDLTSATYTTGANELEIDLDNTADNTTIPYAADFSFFNGLDRGVRLVEAGRLCFDPTLYGTKRCKITTNVATRTATLQCSVVNHNSNTEAYQLVCSIYTATGTEALDTASANITAISAAERKAASLDVVVPSANFSTWNGRISPTCYKVVIELKQGDTVLDSITTIVGFRTFAVEKHTTASDGAGFLLNGVAYKLYGTNYHTDKAGRASALTANDYTTDLAQIEDLKPTMIKFAHYPCDHALLDYCDEHGIVAMLEIPWSRNFPASTSSIATQYRANITAAMLNMVNEYYNHPSVIFWCFDNELGYNVTLGYDADELHTFLANLYTQVKAIDAQRLIGVGLYINTSSERSWTDVADIMLSTHYKGWYSGTVGESLNDANNANTQMAVPKGINEFGYGAVPTQHIAWSDASTAKPDSPNSSTSIQYEEYQAYAFEQYLNLFKNIQWPVFNLQWVMYDFASGTRAEGGTSAINTKGLITRDRSTIKDAYYLFKAYWNTSPMVHICQKRWTNRGTITSAALHVYSNCAKLVLSINGTIFQTLTAANGTLGVCWDFDAATLATGDNVFLVSGYTNADDAEASVTDTWTYSKAGETDISAEIIGNDTMVNSGVLTAVITPSATSQEVTWSSSNPDAATIDSTGAVTVLSDANVIFTATSTADTSVTATWNVKCRKILDTANELKTIIDSMIAAGKDAVGTITTYQGVTISNEGGGEFMLNGTVSGGQGYEYTTFLYRSSDPYSRGCYPYDGIVGDLVTWIEPVSGTVTGWGSGSGCHATIKFFDDIGNEIPSAMLRILGDSASSTIIPIPSTCYNNTTAIASTKMSINLTDGAVFDNYRFRIGTAKIPTTVYSPGILTTIPAIGTVNYMPTVVSTISRNCDGSISIGKLPNSKSQYVRLWDSFDATAKHTTGETVQIAAGTPIKFSVDLFHVFDVGTLASTDEIRWVLRGSDGTAAGAIDYVLKGSSAISSEFDDGHVEITLTPTVDILGVEFLQRTSNIGSELPSTHYTHYYRFNVKVEEVTE